MIEFDNLRNEYEVFIRKYGDTKENKEYALNKIGIKAKDKFLTLASDIYETHGVGGVGDCKGDFAEKVPEGLKKFLKEGDELDSQSIIEKKQMEVKIKISENKGLSFRP